MNSFPEVRTGHCCSCMGPAETSTISSHLDVSSIRMLRCLARAAKCSKMECRDSFAGSPKVCSIVEDLKYRTNELADFVTAAAQHYKFAADQVRRSRLF